MQEGIRRMPVVEVALGPLDEVVQDDLRSVAFGIGHFVRVPERFRTGAAAHILQLVFLSGHQIAIGRLLWRSSP